MGNAALGSFLTRLIKLIISPTMRGLLPFILLSLLTSSCLPSANSLKLRPTNSSLSPHISPTVNSTIPLTPEVEQTPELGWTQISPSSTSRQIYVSSSQGSDQNDGLSPERPLKTIAYGLSQLRNGQDDWLRLRSGDVFNEVIGKLRISGHSEQRPMVFTSYDSGPRPKLLTGGQSAIRKEGDMVKHLVFMGLEFHNNFRDPQSPTFNINSTSALFYWIGDSENILVEDCAFHWGGIVVQRYTGTTLERIRFRRNLVYGAYNLKTSGHSQGLYASKVDGLLLEENIFDHNGWNESISGAEATMFNHNIYISESNNVILRGNLFLRASSMGNKLRSDVTYGSHSITIEDNLYYDGEIGLGIGGNTTAPHRFLDVKVKNNVFLEIGRSNPTQRNFSWGIDVADNQNAEYLGNTFLHFDLWSNNFGLQLSGGTNKNILISKNIFHGIKQNMIKLKPQTNWTNVSIRENTFQNYSPSYAPALSLEGDFSHLNFEQNQYQITESNVAWLNGKTQSFSQWRQSSSETGGLHSLFPSSSHHRRSLETYMMTLGESPTIDRFLELLHKQQKSSWRPELTAQQINIYLRGELTLP